MKGREIKGASSADLLVCLPSRSHLTLMPNPICNPARPSEANKRHRRLSKKSTTRNSGGSANKQMGHSEITEPTSPKVTCAGQIKARSNAVNTSKSWQSVMEEIERIHNNRQHNKRRSTNNWVESLGQFLTCLRTSHFDFRCLRNLTQSDDITTDDDEADQEDEKYPEIENNVEDNQTSRTVFSEWFMVLHENQNNGFYSVEKKEKESSPVLQEAAAIPPPNALLLMRCSSAPAKSRFTVEEKEENIEESLMTYVDDSDFYEISSDIAKETWLVGGLEGLLSRSRSRKR